MPASSRRPIASPSAWCAAIVGLSDFSDDAVRDPAVVALASKVRYRIDPDNPYPRGFTGHIHATLADGRVVEERQPHLRGGAQEPLTRADIEEKFLLNARHGGYDDKRARAALALLCGLYAGAIDLSSLRGVSSASNIFWLHRILLLTT